MTLRTRIKVCGLTRPADVRAAVAAGVDALGFNLAQGPRRITPTDAARLAALTPPLVQTVALFVDADEATIREAMELSTCRVVQLHGDELPTLAEALRADYLIIKAFRVRDAATLALARRYPCDLLLLDAWVPGAAGGTGVAWDWELLRDWDGPPVMLAGGLRPDNVGAAIRVARPFAVDCASGVEAAPGEKDEALLRAFSTAVAEADRA